MEHYDTRTVIAPDWMEKFQCLAGDCPEVCCQQWNVDVDPAHAESLRQIEDPDLQELMNRVLRTVSIRRPGSRKTDIIHRLQLLSQPDHRCPLLNDRGECRLQKKYGPYVLCDTCYFHPRTFWQIDEKTYLSACLSCPECARLALSGMNPVKFRTFSAEVDPTLEWLETELISDPDTQAMLRSRDRLISVLCDLLQDRTIPFPERIAGGMRFLLDRAADGIRSDISGYICPDKKPDRTSMMEKFTDIFDPVSNALEKPAQATAVFMHALAGGNEGYCSLLAANFEKGKAIYDPFIDSRQYLEENFMVHCVFSDSFKQFIRYQNDSPRPENIYRHEAALLLAWFWFFRVLMCQTSLEHGGMSEQLFFETVSHADKLYWHYPDWFGRCADRLEQLLPEEQFCILRSL